MAVNKDENVHYSGSSFPSLLILIVDSVPKTNQGIGKLPHADSLF